MSHKHTQVTSTEEIIARNLYILRKWRGFTQQELGQAIDVTAQQIQKYEKARNRISAGTLYHIACTLEVHIEQLYAGLRDMPQKAHHPGERFILHSEEKRIIKNYRKICRAENRKHAREIIEQMVKYEHNSQEFPI